MIQERLIPVSHGLVSPIFWKTLVNVSKNPCDEIFRPSNPFNCDATIMTDVADVKPTVTGIEMKSISTPAKLFFM